MSPADVMSQHNDSVRDVAERRRWRIRRLEDGEAVIVLNGDQIGAQPRGIERHAGIWSMESWYVLVEHSRPASLASALARFDPGLCPQVNDVGILLLGPPERIHRLLDCGPHTCRAKRKRPATKGMSAAHMAAIRPPREPR